MHSIWFNRFTRSQPVPYFAYPLVGYVIMWMFHSRKEMFWLSKNCSAQKIKIVCHLHSWMLCLRKICSALQVIRIVNDPETVSPKTYDEDFTLLRFHWLQDYGRCSTGALNTIEHTVRAEYILYLALRVLNKLFSTLTIPRPELRIQTETWKM